MAVRADARWRQLLGEPYALALYCFSASSPAEMDLFCGDTVRIEEELGDWYKGYAVDPSGSHGRHGVFPRAYVRLRKAFVQLAALDGSAKKPLPTLPPRSARSASNAEAAAAGGGAPIPVSAKPSSPRAPTPPSRADSAPQRTPPRPSEPVVTDGRPNSPRSKTTSEGSPRAPKMAVPSPRRVVNGGVDSSPLLGRRKASAVPIDPISDPKDPVMLDLVNAMREWSSLMWASYLEHNMQRYADLKDRLFTLRSWHSRICNLSLPANVRDAIKGQVKDKIEKGTRAMKLDLITRNEMGEVLTDRNAPVAMLFNGFRAQRHQGKKMSRVVESPQTTSVMTHALHKITLRAASLSVRPKQGGAQSDSGLGAGLVVRIDGASIGVGQSVQLGWSLWSKGDFITDTYWVSLSEKLQPEDPNLSLGAIRTVFRDLSNADLTSGSVWLVCRTLRTGAYDLEKKSKMTARRPLAVSIIQLTRALWTKTNNGVAEVSMDMLFPPQESQFSAFVGELIAASDRTNYAFGAKCQNLRVALQPHYAQPEVDLMDSLRGLGGLTVTEHLSASRTDRRVNQLLVTLLGAEISQERSVEVVVEALDSAGIEIPRAFRIGVGGVSACNEYRSYVMRHVVSPVWRESFFVDLDVAKPRTTTLLISLYHVTKTKSVALGCATLALSSPSGTVLSNTTHTLSVGKVPKRKADLLGASGDHATSISSVFSSAVGAVKSPRHLVSQPMTVSLTTRLESTELSQNPAMESLLHWREERNSLLDVLNRFLYVEQVEITRFLPETCTALFDILALEIGDDLIEAGFYALMHVLSMLVDERVSHGLEQHRVLLERYIQHQFVSVSADTKLTQCLSRAFDDPVNNKKRLVSVLKGMGYLLRFIFRSVELRIRKKPNFAAVQSVRLKLKAVFASLCRLTSLDTVALLSIQATAVKSFASWTSQLALFFPPRELAQLYTELMASLPTAQSASDKKQSLSGEKLHLLHHLVVSDPVFLHAEARSVFFAMLLHEMETCVASAIPDVRRFASILSSGLTEALQSHGQKGLPDEVLAMLPTLLRIYRQAQTDGEEAFAEAATNLLFFFYSMSGDQFVALFGTDAPLLQECVTCLVRLNTKSAYDATWLAMIMFQYTASLCFLENAVSTASTLAPRWLVTLMQLCMDIMSADALDLSSFSESKRSMLEESYGDLRLRGIAFLKEAFRVLEGRQEAGSTKKLVSYYLALSMISQPEIKRLGVHHYFTALKHSYSQHGSFSEVLQQTIDVLGQPRAISRDLGGSLVALLQKRFSGSQELASAGAELVEFIRGFRALLQSVHELPYTPDYEIERTIATLSLLDYLTSASSSSYNAYAVQLLVHHLKANQPTEGAAVLLRMADTLEASDVLVEPMETVWGSHVPFPEEPSVERKTRMLQEAVSMLEKDSQYEKALDVVSLLLELAQSAGRDTAPLLKQRAALETALNSEDRLVTEYFRVGFYGKGFQAMSGKAFIFRGGLLERLDEFNARMLQQFPGATLLTYTHVPEADVRDSSERHLQIFRVMPSSFSELEGNRLEPDMGITANMRRFRRYNDVEVFVYEKPVKKGTSGSDVADLWIENTFYVASMPLPNIARFAEVAEVVVSETSPLALAIKTMEDKNRDLVDGIGLYGGPNAPVDAQPFISLVQGVVDAAVGGGFRTYQDVFFSNKFGTWDTALAARITDLIDEQIDLMASALDVWPRVCPASFAPLLEHLQSQHAVVAKQRST